MTRAHLELAVLGPEVDGAGNAGHAALVGQLSSLSAADLEFEVCIFLPVSKKQRELGEEAVVYVAYKLDGGRAGVAIDAALELRHANGESFPGLKIILIGDLAISQRGI